MNVRQLVCHLLYIDSTVEDNELCCYNTEGDRNSVVSQASWKMGWTLLELKVETVLTILGEDLHLQKIASKWLPNALTEVEN